MWQVSKDKVITFKLAEDLQSFCVPARMGIGVGAKVPEKPAGFLVCARLEMLRHHLHRCIMSHAGEHNTDQLT